MTETCQFNSGIECPILGRHCDTCGWNPEVQEARLKEFYAHPRGTAAEREEG